MHLEQKVMKGCDSSQTLGNFTQGGLVCFSGKLCSDHCCTNPSPGILDYCLHIISQGLRWLSMRKTKILNVTPKILPEVCTNSITLTLCS